MQTMRSRSNALAIMVFFVASPVVLVVDDYDEAREGFAAWLRCCGFGVLLAKSGEEALAVARGSSPDVVLMDLVMPEMDGVEATRRLKADPRTRRIPVLALTGLPPSEEAKRAGCISFLVKPFRPESLTAEINRALADRNR